MGERRFYKSLSQCTYGLLVARHYTWPFLQEPCASCPVRPDINHIDVPPATLAAIVDALTPYYEGTKPHSFSMRRALTVSAEKGFISVEWADKKAIPEAAKQPYYTKIRCYPFDMQRIIAAEEQRRRKEISQQIQIALPQADPPEEHPQEKAKEAKE